ncbi:MAG: integrase arm-type DNA-binding domain-containing protein [Rhizobiales bacterium]|nr:integrase arm-type DNA-binding domain-containing protein [Hyphomicrobiales bacterium]
MPVAHLTDIVVSRLKQPGTYFDDHTPAFGIRIGKKRKTWIVVRGRERTRTRIGHYPAISLADARKKALVLLGSPVEREEKAPFFKDALEKFYSIHLPTLKPKSQYQIKRALDRHFVPKLKHKRLNEITHREICAITDALAPNTPSEAWHAFKDARIFFRWCVPRFVKHSPMEGLRSPTRYVPRKRVLTNTEIAKVWEAADEVGYPFGTAIQLSLLWGTRWGETISTRRAYIDEREKTITLPDTKNGTEHCFPYGLMTKAILKTIPRYNSTDLLFPGRDMATPWNGAGKAKCEFKELCDIAPWQLLDLRRTFATKLAEQKVPPHIVERLLNHKLGTLKAQGVITAVAEVYNRALYLDEMRDAIEDRWEPFLKRLLVC